MSVPLPAALDVAALAERSVAAISESARQLSGADALPPEPARIAAAYMSDKYLRIDGKPIAPFAALSGFFRASDGWVRTHANYAWHEAALLRALALPPEAGRERVAAAISALPAQAIAATARSAGALAVVVAPTVPAALRSAATSPLVTHRRLGSTGRRDVIGEASAPLNGVRVLDLTRVIAGPVATRTLALLGADVLRIDPPGRPEFSWQHLDTGHGKRTAVLDGRSDRFRELLEDADVIVSGYRPGALRALGIDLDAHAQTHPGTVIASLSAWGSRSGRGFDSLVQAATGIAAIESRDGVTPGVLPAQALDHSAGYLLAAAICDALANRSSGSVHVATSLVRIAAELICRGTSPSPGPFSPSLLNEEVVRESFTVGGMSVQTVAPAISYVGAPTRFAAPHAWGSDTAEWRD